MPAYTTETVDTRGRRQVLATILFLVAALVLSYLPSPAQQRVASLLRGTVLRPFVTTQEGVRTARLRSVEADRLRVRLDSLVAVLAGQGTLVEENRRLRATLALSEKLGPSFSPATVVRSGTAGSESMFMVDVGTDDGVHPDSPVISAQGLVGVIRDVRANQSMGMDWTHPDFRASAMTADGTTFGIVESRRGRFREEDRLVLNGTAFHTRLEDGTVVVTSGLGGVFPRGVPIGLVNGLAEAEGGWRKSYWLRPLAEPGMATHVLVATGSAAEGPTDLSPVWPADSVMTEEELAAREQARVDSLDALGDSLAALERALAVIAARDSARLAGLDAARADSLARATGRRLAAEDSVRRGGRDAPPEAAAPASGRARTGSAAAGSGGAAPSGAGAGAPRRAVTRPPIRAPDLRPSTPATGEPGQVRPAVPVDPGPARVRPADTAGVRPRVPTDTIRIGPGGDSTRRPADTLRTAAARGRRAPQEGAALPPRADAGRGRRGGAALR